MIILVFISLFCLIQSNPIYEIKNCDINESIDLDLKLIKGDWFELVRTNFIFNEKTWHNGFVTIFDKDSLLKLNYSGVDKYFLFLFIKKYFKYLIILIILVQIIASMLKFHLIIQLKF